MRGRRDDLLHDLLDATVGHHPRTRDSSSPDCAFGSTASPTQGVGLCAMASVSAQNRFAPRDDLTQQRLVARNSSEPAALSAFGDDADHEVELDRKPGAAWN